MELVVAERTLARLAEQNRAKGEAAPAVTPAPARVEGRTVLLIGHRSENPDESALPKDYRTILQLVRDADGPVQVRAVGERLGPDASVRGMLEPLRAKLNRLAGGGVDRGQDLHVPIQVGLHSGFFGLVVAADRPDEDLFGPHALGPHGAVAGMAGGLRGAGGSHMPASGFVAFGVPARLRHNAWRGR
ncbi:hypothetical protein [Streptomyces flavofungini]|uniref:hypothetical protein n=1 Tax=Streptomyces flavofungini TaxID=68200 RepID=UPI0025B0CD23|nr:hypothetical protein [Streptomyces flavofungini]WJV44783.1 hypothetical protein QUY26_04105 [Streptomyces flavofungini]